jgi:putative transposase
MLRRLLGAKRHVWNWALAESNKQWRDSGERKPHGVLSKEFSAKRSGSWLADLPREPFQQVLRDLDRAFVNAFAGRAQPPVFKRRGSIKTLRFTLDQRREQVDRHGGSVQLQGLGRVRFRVTETLLGRLRSVTLSLDSAGRWHANFTADQVPAPQASQARVSAVGLDLGLRDAVVLSTGEKFAAPKPLKAKLAKLRRYQRRFSRQRDHQLRRLGLDPGKAIPKGLEIPASHRGRKTQQAIGRLHAQIADQRREFQHQVTRKIVDIAQVVVLEDLDLKAMTQSMGRRAFRRSLADVGLGEIRRQITYKARWAGRTVVAVDRFYPSSKTCGSCRQVNGLLTLRDRDWACPGCGAQHDRDLNAARNIEREGLRLLAEAITPRSGGIDARGESRGESVATPGSRAHRTANLSVAS